MEILEGLNRFNFHTPFDWDGSSNLLVEISIEAITGPDPAIHADNQENNFLVSNNQSMSALEFGGSWGVELDPALFAPISDQLTIAFWAFGRPQWLPNKIHHRFRSPGLQRKKKLSTSIFPGAIAVFTGIAGMKGVVMTGSTKPPVWKNLKDSGTTGPSLKTRRPAA
jgi:hypothetical protein